MTFLANIVIWIGIVLAVLGFVLSVVPLGPEAIVEPGTEIDGVPPMLPFASLSIGLVLIAAGVLVRMTLGFVRQRRRAVR